MRVTGDHIHEAFSDDWFIERMINQDFAERWGNNEEITFEFERVGHPQFEDIFMYRLGFKAGSHEENTVTINVGGENKTSLVISDVDLIDDEVISPYTMKILAMGIRSLMYTTNIQNIGFEVTFDLELGPRRQRLIKAAERLRASYLDQL